MRLCVPSRLLLQQRCGVYEVINEIECGENAVEETSSTTPKYHMASGANSDRVNHLT